MDYGLWLSAAGLQVNQHQQAVIANNLANLNTAGFKRDLAIARDRLVESQSGPGGIGFRNRILDNLSGGTFVNPTATDFTQGAMENGSPLDVGISGDGFFTVQVGSEVRYTRDGRFTLNKDGDLVTAVGQHPVLDKSNQPIHIGQEDPERISIESGGRIAIGDREVGTLGVVDFADRRLLIKAGANTFDGRYAKAVEATGDLRQGFFEASGVEPSTELVRMVEVARLYQLNASLISLQDGMIGRAVNDVGRVA
jgi:flagellar basal-body rod protein FlgF